MMMTKFLLFVSLLFLGALTPSEGEARSCKFKEEGVIVLKDPVFNGRRIWGMNYGGAGVEQINDVVVAHNDGETFTENSYVIAGDYTTAPESNVLRPFLAHVTRKGKVLWENKNNGSLKKTIKKLIKTDTGYAVLGNIKNSKNWRGFYIERFNKKGKLLSRTPVYGDDYHADGQSMVETEDKKGFIVAAMHNFNKDGTKSEAALYRIDHDGALAWRRRYNAGLNMKFYNIQLLPNKFYAVTGSVDHKKTGKTLGLLMLMDETGEKGWQQQYHRGDVTSIKKVVTMADDSMILIGGTVPAGSEKESAMVMKVNASGSMIWRRFYIGDYRYVVQDVATLIYDRILIMLDAYPEVADDRKKPPKGHVQMLTLSTRGDMLGVESFTSGQNAHAGRVLQGDKREHIIVGTVQAKNPELVPVDELPPPKFDGWLVASKLKYESYEDLCAPSE